MERKVRINGTALEYLCGGGICLAIGPWSNEKRNMAAFGVLVFLPDKAETGAPEEGRLHADGDLVGVAALLLLLVAVLAAEEPVVVHGVPGVVIIIEMNCQNRNIS